MKHLNFLKAPLALVLLVGAGSCGTESGPNWKSSATGMEFVKIKPGTFTMGSPASEEGRKEDEAQHRVTLAKGYWLGKTEVTQGQWEAVMGSNPSHFKGVDRPVENVSWDESQAFIQKLCKREGVPEGTYRLPTEAEWEYACRAGTTGAYAGELGEMGWYDENSREKPRPVGQKKPNAWGLYDMHGNVWEWCQDWYGNYPADSVTDPSGPASGSFRVLRGGGWFRFARSCRSATRSRDVPGLRGIGMGFRLLKTE